jgi:F0F1-type ATP synthase membrane subunit b/b'
MEFLQNLFSNLSTGVIRLGVTVGILAAVGFFIVKPVLETTEKTVENTNHTIEKSFEHSFEGGNVNVKGIEESVNKQIEDVNKQVQEQVEKSFHVAKKQGGEAKTEKLLHCIQRAHQNVHRIERCSQKYS